MREIKVDADKYGRLLMKYLKEDLSDLFGVDINDAPAYLDMVKKTLDGANDPVLADDILDGAARWYAYKQTVKIREAVKRGMKL